MKLNGMLFSAAVITVGFGSSLSDARTAVERKLGPLQIKVGHSLFEQVHSLGEGLGRGSVAPYKIFVDPGVKTTLLITTAHGEQLTLHQGFREKSLLSTQERSQLEAARAGRGSLVGAFLIDGLAKWHTSKGISLGDSRSRVLQAYGNPSSQPGRDTLRYDEETKNQTFSAEFTFNDDTLIDISIGYRDKAKYMQ